MPAELREIPAQLELPEPVDAPSLGGEFRRRLTCAVQTIGVKPMAGELDTDPTFLTNAIAGKAYAHLRAEWVPVILATARPLSAGDDPLVFLADVRRLDLAPKRPLTDAERLARVQQVLGRLLTPEMLQLVDAMVNGGGR